MSKLSPLALLATAGAAAAHSGHDAAVTEGAAHWLRDPDHWIVLALGALVAAELARRAWRGLRNRRRGEDTTPS